MSAAGRSVTVRQLLGTRPFEGVELIGGSTGLDRPVTDVTVRRQLALGTELLPHSLVVIDGAVVERHSYLVDQAIRCIEERSGSGLIVANGPQHLGETARRMADRFCVPLFRGVPTTCSRSPSASGRCCAKRRSNWPTPYSP